MSVANGPAVVPSTVFLALVMPDPPRRCVQAIPGAAKSGAHGMLAQINFELRTISTFLNLQGSPVTAVGSTRTPLMFPHRMLTPLSTSVSPEAQNIVGSTIDAEVNAASNNDMELYGEPDANGNTAEFTANVQVHAVPAGA